MEWLIFAFMLLLFPFAFIKFLLENIGVVFLFVFAAFVIGGIMRALFSEL